MGRTYTKSVLVTEDTHAELEALKYASGEAYGSVVARLIKFYKDNKNTVEFNEQMITRNGFEK